MLAQVFTCETFKNRTSSVPEINSLIGQSETHDVIDRSFIVVILCITTEVGIYIKNHKKVVIVVKLNRHSKYSSTMKRHF